MKEYIILLAALLVALVALWCGFYFFGKREKDEAKREAIEKAKDLCEKLLTQVALALFTEAERKFGDGTGKLKMSYVVERFLALLPAEVQELLDTNWLLDRLETLLIEAKEEWTKNSKLLG